MCNTKMYKNNRIKYFLFVSLTKIVVKSVSNSMFYKKNYTLKNFKLFYFHFLFVFPKRR